MCGLVFVSRTDGRPAQKMVMRRYESQKDRGMKGYGYVCSKEGKIVSIQRELYGIDIEKKIKEEEGDQILFHHRFPTSTENMIEATHPIEVKNPVLEYDYYLAHNGIVSNEDELRKNHEERGFVYNTVIRYKTITRLGKYCSEEFNDSESLAIEVALVIDGKKEKIETSGSAAFICIQAEKETGRINAVFYGRNSSNPLKFHSEKDFVSIASEGQGELIKPDILYRIDGTSGLRQEKPLDIGTGYRSHVGYHHREEQDDEYYGRNGKPGYSNAWGGYIGRKWVIHSERKEDDLHIQSLLPGSIAARAAAAMIGADKEPDEEESVEHPDDARREALKDFADLEEIYAGLERDLEVLEERRRYVVSLGDDEAEMAMIQEIEKKKKEMEDYQDEMITAAIEAGGMQAG